MPVWFLERLFIFKVYFMLDCFHVTNMGKCASMHSHYYFFSIEPLPLFNLYFLMLLKFLYAYNILQVCHFIFTIISNYHFSPFDCKTFTILHILRASSNLCTSSVHIHRCNDNICNVE